MLSAIFLYLDSATDDGQYEIVSIIVSYCGLASESKVAEHSVNCTVTA